MNASWSCRAANMQGAVFLRRATADAQRRRAEDKTLESGVGLGGAICTSKFTLVHLGCLVILVGARSTGIGAGEREAADEGNMGREGLFEMLA